MAKGKTTQPLWIGVWEMWRDHPEIAKLREAGHHIAVVDTTDYDLILHPAAWRWGEWAWPYLEQTVREARRAKRAREETS